MIGIVTGTERKKNKDGALDVLMIKCQITNPNDVQEVQAYHGANVDFNPPDGVKVNIESIGTAFKIGTAFILEKIPGETGRGEYRIYSTDAAGSLQAEIYLKADGTIQINKGTDFAVAFNDLKSGFDQLKSDFNNLITAYNAHVHSGVTTGPGLSGPGAPQGIQTTASIDNSKVDEVRLP